VLIYETSVVDERSEATNLDDGSPILSKCWYVYIYVRTSFTLYKAIANIDSQKQT